MISFRELFVGSDQSHGAWNQLSGGHTVDGPASEHDYSQHLEGSRGLGLVPVRRDGTCRFAAIDIDVDTINHQDLWRQVQTRRLPLHVCRSKSGGAHLYLFVQEPGIKASIVSSMLRRWAIALGFPRAEVFPKQGYISKENVGSWLNLPYLGSDRTTRYAVGEHGAQSLDEFLSTINFYHEGMLVDDSPEVRSVDLGQMPPCLVQITKMGVLEGSRNPTLFNVGVFFRKADPENWAQRLEEYNIKEGKPPLPVREIKGIIKSLDRSRYQYTCNQEPLCSNCDRKNCVTLPHGVNHMPWMEDDSFDHLEVNNLKKILTDPPRYIATVNEKATELTWDELFDHRVLRRRLNQLYDLVLPPMKEARWESQLRTMLKVKQDIPTPRDASGFGLVLARVIEFLNLSGRTERVEDLLKGLPVALNGRILFRVADLQKYLAGFKMDRVDTTTLYQMLYKEGGDAQDLEVKGKKVTVWRLPKEKLNLQTEEFTRVDLGDKKKEELF